MERSFHMLLYRAFHAQRSYLGHHLAITAPVPRKPSPIILKSTRRQCAGCWTLWRETV